MLAIDHCIELNDLGSDIAPSMINMSLGSADTGDPNDPLRMATRAALNRGIWFACAAGNYGPQPGTITSPATERYARAVGSVHPETFLVSQFSSRGPTKEGIVKPDLVMPGENIIVASSQSDMAIKAKSGTSFATPFITGLNALLLEGMGRAITLSPELSEQFPTLADAMRDWMDPASFEPLLAYMTVKPQGALHYKDNEYGYGVPLGTLVKKFYGVAAATDMAAVTSMVAPLMTMGLVGMMMGTMTRTLR